MVSAPSPPDPMQTAQAQASFNQQAAETQQALNMTNQVTPYGTLTYSLSPGADQVTKGWGGFGGKGGVSAFPGMYTATTALSGPMQKLFNIDLGNATTSAKIVAALQRNVMASAEQPLDLSRGATGAKL